MPSIAVAAGFHVFIYRQMRPYRKVSHSTCSRFVENFSHEYIIVSGPVLPLRLHLPKLIFGLICETTR